MRVSSGAFLILISVKAFSCGAGYTRPPTLTPRQWTQDAHVRYTETTIPAQFTVTRLFFSSRSKGSVFMATAKLPAHPS